MLRLSLMIGLAISVLIGTARADEPQAPELNSDGTPKKIDKIPETLTDDEIADLDKAHPKKVANSTAWKAQIAFDKKTPNEIANLSLPKTLLPVVMVYHQNKLRPLTEIEIEYNRPGWKLYVQNNIPVTTTAIPNRYKIFAFLNGQFNEVDLVARGPNKARETARLLVLAPEAQEFEVVSPWDAVTFTLGGSYWRYKQSNFDEFRSWSGLASIAYHSPEERAKFGVLSEVSLTAVNFITNQGSYGPQIGQAVLDGAYFFDQSASSHWRNQALAGVDYLTMYSNGAPFGFKNLFAMEIGARSRYIVDQKTDWVGEFHINSVGTGLDPSQRGIYASIAKGWTLQNLHRGELGVRLVDYQYTAGYAHISMQAWSYTFGYSF